MVVARLLLVACFAAGVLVAPAHAEMPQNHAAPEIGGGAAVGEVMLGHNGTWLYADGSGCGPECSFSFRWERCSAARCATVSMNRGYRPTLADLGRELRLAVTATKYDCGAWNNATGTQECALTARSAYAAPVSVRTRARVGAAAVSWPARLKIERAAVRRGVLRVTVADTLGRLVVGANVSVAGGGLFTRTRTRTRSDGTAALRLPAKGPLVVVARAGSKVVRIGLR